MGYNLAINGIYWGYNPLTIHLLTSWDIQVQKIQKLRKTKSTQKWRDLRFLNSQVIFALIAFAKPTCVVKSEIVYSPQRLQEFFHQQYQMDGND